MIKLKPYTERLLCLICCQIYFALFFILLKVEVQKKEQQQIEHKRRTVLNVLLYYMPNLSLLKIPLFRTKG